LRDTLPRYAADYAAFAAAAIIERRHAAIMPPLLSCRYFITTRLMRYCRHAEMMPLR